MPRRASATHERYGAKSSASAAASATTVVFVVTHAMTADLLLDGHLAELGRAGLDIALITSPSERLERIAKRESVAVYPVAMRREISPLHDLVALPRLWRTLRRLRPKLVVASTPKAGLLGLLAARAARVPHRIYTLRGLRLETTEGLKRAVLTACERTASRAATRVLAVSPSLRQRFLQLRLITASTRISVPGAGSSNGVDLTRFSAVTTTKRTTERRALSFTPDDFVIGFVGRLTRDKGLSELLEAVSKLPPNVRLLILGDAESGDPLDARTADQLANDSRILRLGFQRDTEQYYPLMDLLAFPSHREGLPNAPLEAAACGVPTVGFTATGTVDAVVHDETGTLVPVGDVGGLYRAIDRYRCDPQRLAQHGAAARRRVEQSFSRAVVWRAWQTAYRTELESSRP